MAINKISDTTLRALKSTAAEFDGKKRLDDGGGLYLLLAVKGGGRAWRFDYTFQSKRKTISFGTYPDTSLKLARKKAEEARQQLAESIDPSASRKAQRESFKQNILEQNRNLTGAPIPNSFEDLALEWIEARTPIWSESYARKTQTSIEKDLLPWLGKLPIADIKSRQLLECLRRIEERGASEVARKVRGIAGEIWRFAIASGRAEYDISAALVGALKPRITKNYSYLKDPKQLGQLMMEIESYSGSPMVKAALRILPLVFTRPGEFRKARWEDIDLTKAEWRYVATKTNADHIVPLSTQVVGYLKELFQLTGNGEFVFGVRGGIRPLSDGTINAALKSIGYSSEIIQPHGFRHTAATMLAEMGWKTEAIERQLAHKEPGVKGIYQKAQYLEERRKMMQAWSDFVVVTLPRILQRAEILLPKAR